MASFSVVCRWSGGGQPQLTIADPSEEFPRGGFICRVCHRDWSAEWCSDTEAEDEDMQANNIAQDLNGEAQIAQLRLHAASERHVVLAQVATTPRAELFMRYAIKRLLGCLPAELSQAVVLCFCQGPGVLLNHLSLDEGATA